MTLYRIRVLLVESLDSTVLWRVLETAKCDLEYDLKVQIIQPRGWIHCGLWTTCRSEIHPTIFHPYVAEIHPAVWTEWIRMSLLVRRVWSNKYFLESEHIIIK